jgi:hypothetical protein
MLYRWHDQGCPGRRVWRRRRPVLCRRGSKGDPGVLPRSRAHRRQPGRCAALGGEPDQRRRAERDSAAASPCGAVLGGLLHGSLHGDDRTAGNTITTVQQAMSLFFQEQIRSRCALSAGRLATDLADVIRRSGTIYLLGREDPYASASPLMTAVAEHVLDTALELANTSPWGRLCPPSHVLWRRYCGPAPRGDPPAQGALRACSRRERQTHHRSHGSLHGWQSWTPAPCRPAAAAHWLTKDVSGCRRRKNGLSPPSPRREIGDHD